MTLIEPVKQQIGNPAITKKHSSSLRLWHWLNTIVISGSLITVLINSTILKSRKSAPLVQATLQKGGVNATFAQARSAVNALSDKVWSVHIYFGYCLAALFLFRLIAEFFQLTDQKFIKQVKKAWQQFKTLKREREKAKHEVVVKIIYMAFYLLLLTMIITGLCWAFDDSLAFPKTVQRIIQNIHGFCMYLVLAFIVVHLTGVWLAERKDGKGIVSDMINGG
jgi:Ni/Fe-hydrogenase 1 B-type cytochrome subunit